MPKNKLHKPDKQDADDNIKVVVRCRPLNKKEIEKGHKQSIIVDEIRGTITVNKLKTPWEQPRMFTYDTVFGPDSKQLDVYNLTARPIIDSVLKGFNGTIFAYGQTGTGKTFTMEGEAEVPELRGIIPNSFAHIYDHIAKAEGDKRFSVHVSYLEIYNEEVWDLLHRDKKQRLEVKESPDIGVYVKDLSRYAIHRAGDMNRIMRLGHKNRSVGATNMNEHSSRSHAIITITLECSEKGVDGKQHERIGKLHLVDLAGSERQGKSGATGQRFKEATKINLSLSTLGNVIAALVDGKSTHVPYRNSKLTRLLQDSLGGNSKTLMCANIGPADYYFDETISTLCYASRATKIKNKARMNVDPDHSLLLDNDKECEELQKQLDELDKILAADLKAKEKMKKAEEQQKKEEAHLKMENEQIKKKPFDQECKMNGEKRTMARERQAMIEAIKSHDYISVFQSSKRLSASKARNLHQLSQAVHELKKSDIDDFEISDNESKHGGKKSASYLKTERISSASGDSTESELHDNKLSDSSISRHTDDNDPFSRQSNDDTQAKANKIKTDQYSYSDDFSENEDDFLSVSKPSKKLSTSKASNRHHVSQAVHELKKSNIDDFEISDNESKHGRKKSASYLKTQRISSASGNTTASELHDNKLSDSSISRHTDDNDPFSRQSNDDTQAKANKIKTDQYSYSDDFSENEDDFLSVSKPSKKLSTSKASNRHHVSQAVHELKKSNIDDFEISDNESKHGRKKSASYLKTQRISSASGNTTASELHDNKLSDSSISRHTDDNDPFSRQSNDDTQAKANKIKTDQYSYSDDFSENEDDFLSVSKPSKKLSTSKASNRHHVSQAVHELKTSDIDHFEISDNESKHGRKKSASYLKTERISSASGDSTESELHDNKLSDSSISRHTDDNDPFSRQSNDDTQAKANKIKTDQYSYSDDFSENEDDFLSVSKPSKRLSTSKASNRHHLSQAVHELKKSDINDFEISDNESKHGRKKRASYLKTQRISSASGNTTASELHDNKLSYSSISRHTDDNDSSSTLHSKDKTQFKNRDESVLPCENNMKPQGPAKKSNSFQVEFSLTPLSPEADFRLMSSAADNTEENPPKPKSRQRTLGLSHQATEKIVRDLSRPQTSSASIPLSIDTSSNTANSSPNNIGADPDQLSRGHEQLFDTRTTSSHLKTFKRPQVVYSKEVESKYLGSLKFLDEKVSLHESQPQSVNSLRATNYQAWIKKKQEVLRENKKKEEILKEFKKKEEEARREKAAEAVEEWEKKKVEGLKAKAKAKAKEQRARQQEKEAAIKDSAAAFEAWGKNKVECLKAKTKKKQDLIRQEQRVIEEREENRKSAVKQFEIWKHDRGHLLKEKYRKRTEDENDRLLIKNEEESIRKRKSKYAFSNWCEKKRDDLHEKATMERRAAEDKAEEEQYLKDARVEIALEEYEKWRTRKDREQWTQLEERQRQEALHESPHPPWIPPGNLIPFRRKHAKHNFTSNY